MRDVNLNLNWINQKNSSIRSVALGTFDGVHRGHQQLLQETLSRCPDNGTSCVFTFDFPPEQFFRSQHRLLTSFNRKVELIRNFGIDEIAWLPFNETLASLDASEFVLQFLVKILRARQVICGFNYRFGSKRSGDVHFLEKQGAIHGFDVTIVKPVEGPEGKVISSTLIRQLISEGDLEKASQYLGYVPIYEGKVVHGVGRGRELGFPTANLEIDPNLVLPPEGVYLTWCILPNNQKVAAVTSIGKNPTFAGKTQTIEAFILDYNDDLYQQTLQIQFLKQIRTITCYNSAEQLQGQMKRDIIVARQLLSKFHLQNP